MDPRYRLKVAIATLITAFLAIVVWDLVWSLVVLVIGTGVILNRHKYKCEVCGSWRTWKRRTLDGPNEVQLYVLFWLMCFACKHGERLDRRLRRNPNDRS